MLPERPVLRRNQRLDNPVVRICRVIWTAIDIASPAYRVTVPATIYIAALRNMKRNALVAKKAGEMIGSCIESGEFARATLRRV